VYALDR